MQPLNLRAFPRAILHIDADLGSSYAAINGVQHQGKRGERPRRRGMLLKGEGDRKRLGIPLLGEVR